MIHFQGATGAGFLYETTEFSGSRGMCIPDKGKEVFIHYGMKDYDFNTFDGWFIGPIGEYILGITTPGIKIFDEEKPAMVIPPV